MILPIEDLPSTNEDGILLQPEVILETRWIKKGYKIIEKSLVKWKDLPPEKATWENDQELCERFAHLNLGDKVPLKEGSNVMIRRSLRKPAKNPRYFEVNNMENKGN